MSRVFECFIDELCQESGYEYEFLIDRFNEVTDEDDDIDYFIGVTLERDW